MNPDTFVEVIKSFSGAIVGAVAAYAAVKEKLGELLARINATESNLANLKKDSGDALHLVRTETHHAHARLDSHIEKFHAK